MKAKHFVQIIMILLLCGCSKSDDNYSSEPKGACYYGPNGNDACVKTTKDDCENNFKGTWYAGQDCQ